MNGEHQIAWGADYGNGALRLLGQIDDALQVIPFGDFPPIPKLDIEVLVEGKTALAIISQLTSVQTAAIGVEVADLDAHADTFRVAMDFLTQAF